MKRSIYCMKDQVSGQYGEVFDFANDNDCIRAFNNIARSGAIPDYVVRDTVIVKLAEIDFSRKLPVVTGVLPEVVFFGAEVNLDE